MKNFLLTALIVLLLPALALAATEAQKRAAIDSGLAYLATNQNSTLDGHFEGGDYYYDVASTGSAVLAFIEEGWKAGDDVIINGTSYGDVVGDGLNYLLNQAYVYNLPGTAEPMGDPDANGNGTGIKFNTSTGVSNGSNNYNHHRDTYLTGIVLPAIAASGTPDKVVTSGAASGMTYKDVVQDTIDWFAYGQSDSGTARGGWRYYADYNQSDNSTAQWGAIAGLYATEMGVTAQQGVKDELDYWIDHVQNDASGGSGYDSPTSIVNESKTGGLLLEMVFAGSDHLETGNPAYDLTNPDVLAAIDYLNTTWKNTANGTWNGNFGHPYAMWAIYKGLETTIGLNDATYITNLNAQGSALLDAGDTWNWWEDYCEYLVSNFAAGGGHWTGYSSWNAPMATAWGINILNATHIPDDDDDNPVPEPTTMVLFGFGLLGLAGVSRRKKSII